MENRNLIDLIFKYAEQIITFGGQIHPVVGAILGVVLFGISIYWGYLKKRQAYAKQKEDTQKVVTEETAQGQKTIKKNRDRVDDFLDS